MTEAYKTKNRNIKNRPKRTSQNINISLAKILYITVSIIYMLYGILCRSKYFWRKKSFSETENRVLQTKPSFQ